MKKIIALFLFGLMYFTFFDNTFSFNSDTKFIVTAYYSPLPNQKHYSYSVYTNRERTYDEEKRLQGKGIRGASGKKVFSGMLAAPKNYKFGTKIYLEGLGVGEVADRGGAIVNKGIRGHNYDRIDVWMGYGDEGLKRATYWGKRTIKGSYLSKKRKITLDYHLIPVIDGLINNKIIKNQNKEIDIFSKKLKTKNEIKKLQMILKNLGFYNGSIDGINKNIIDSIYKFQLSKGIVKSIYSPGAGNYGPITRKSLKKEYDVFLVKEEEKKEELLKLKKEEEKKNEEKKKLVKEFNDLKELSYKEASEKVDNIGSPRYGEISLSVRLLQNTLKKLGYFEYKDTAIYGNITKKSIITYQIDNKIINSYSDLGAGIIGPKTRKKLKNDLNKLYLKEKINTNKGRFTKIIAFISSEI